MIHSSYVEDLTALMVEDEFAENADYVRLKVKQTDGSRSQIVQVARALLMTSGFFSALLEGGFAEAVDLRSGSSIVEVSADSVDAFILCLRMLATGDTGVLPQRCHELLSIVVEAHRLDFKDVFLAAEQKIGIILLEENTPVELLENICHVAKLFDIERLVAEASARFAEKSLQ